MGSIKNRGRPLIGLATDETIELVEAGMRRPTVERSRDRDFPWRSFVIFAEGGGAIAIQAQHLCQRGYALRAYAGIARKCRGQFHDRAGIVHVMIATCEQRGASGRTKRSSVKVIVTQARGRELFGRFHFTWTPKGARLSEADVVQQNNDDVGRSFSRFNLKARWRLGIAGVQLCNSRWLRLRYGQNGAIEFVVPGLRHS